MDLVTILIFINILIVFALLIINSILLVKLRGTTWVFIRGAQLVVSLVVLVVLVQELFFDVGLPTYLAVGALLLLLMFAGAIVTFTKTQVVDHAVKRTEDIINGSEFQIFRANHIKENHG